MPHKSQQVIVQFIKLGKTRILHLAQVGKDHAGEIQNLTHNPVSKLSRTILHWDFQRSDWLTAYFYLKDRDCVQPLTSALPQSKLVLPQGKLELANKRCIFGLGEVEFLFCYWFSSIYFTSHCKTFFTTASTPSGGSS